MKEQPRYQPDQTQAPQQRGEGIRGIPPPQGEQSQPQQEEHSGLKRYVETMRALSEQDPHLFARRAMEGLAALLEARIPEAVRADREARQDLKAQAKSRDQAPPEEKYWAESRLNSMAYNTLRKQGKVTGLKEAFSALYEHITGESVNIRWRLGFEELAEGTSQEGESDLKK